MKKKRSSELSIGSILSYIQMAIAILLNIIYTPVMIQLLGQSEYGLYNTVASTISMLSVLSLGFGSSYIRFYSQYKCKQDEKAISRLNGLCLLIFSAIGGIALVCGLFLTGNLHIVFKNGLTETEYTTAKVLMFLLTCNLSLSFPMSVFSTIISAHENFVVLKLLGIAKTLAGPLLTLPLLLMGFRSIALVSVTVFVSAVTDVLYLCYVLIILKEKFVFHSFPRGLFRSMFAFTFFIAINIIVDQINNNIDKVLLGRFIGTGAVAVYSVGFTLYSCYMTFSTSISGIFTPRIHQIVNETQNNMELQRHRLTDIFTKVGRLQFIILMLVASGYVFFGKTFITRFWTGAGYEESFYVGILLILPSSIALIQNLGIEIQRAENKHQFRSTVYFLMALLNLVLSVYLCQIYGAVGSAIGTAISLVVANGCIMNVFYHRQCNLDILVFWKSIGQLSHGLLIPAIFGILITPLLSDLSAISFFGIILVYSCLYFCSMWFFGLNNYEKNFVLGIVQKIAGGNDHD